MKKPWRGTGDSLSPHVFKPRLNAFRENKSQSVNLLDFTKDMEGNEIACNNKDIKLPDLIAFIKFRLKRKIKDFCVLAAHPRERRDLNAQLASKFNKINTLFRKPFSLTAQETKALFAFKMRLLSSGHSLPTPSLGQGTPVEYPSPWDQF